jgi:hypothetical protein
VNGHELQLKLNVLQNKSKYGAWHSYQPSMRRKYGFETISDKRAAAAPFSPTRQNEFKEI